MYYIYSILNVINYKFYIGQTCRPQNRWSAHKTEAKSSRAYLPIHKALIKYGVGNFQFSVLEILSSQEETNLREEFWITEFESRGNGGYNLSIGGNSNSGWHHTPESIDKISKSQKGISRRPHTQEEKQQISQSLVGHLVSDETKIKISSSQKGKPRWTEEQKRQMSERRRGRRLSEETKRKMSIARRKRIK